MRITNLTNEPRVVPLNKKDGSFLKLYIPPRTTKTVNEYIVSEEATTLKKARIISIRK